MNFSAGIFKDFSHRIATLTFWSPSKQLLLNAQHSCKNNIVHEIDSSTAHFLVKAILFRKNNFICNREVNSFIINRYFWFFQGLTKIVVDQSLGQLDSFFNHMWRYTVFHFFRTKEFNFKVMLKVPYFVFRFLGIKILEFCEANESYTSAIYDKYCQRLLNVFVGKPVWHCIVSFLTLPSSSL